MRILRPVILLGVLAAFAASPAAAYKVKDVPLPDGTVGQSYSFQFEAVGGTPPHSFAVLTGGLPPGVNLASSGRLTGTPTAAGSWSFWIQAKDGNVSKSERRFTLNIRPRSGGSGGGGGGGTTPPAPPPPAQPFQIRTTDFSPAAVGVAYHDIVRVSGASVSSWAISAGSLPQGLTLTGGDIDGTPRAVGLSTFTVRVGDGTRTIEKQLSIRVVPTVTVNVPRMTPVVVGDRFEAHPTVKGGAAPYRFALTGPTGGQVGVAADGTISGDGRQPGTFAFMLVVFDAAGQKGQARVKLTVTPLLGIATKALPPVVRGKPYRTRVKVVGGVAPRTLALVGGTLPAGISFSPKTGWLSGTVAATAPVSTTLLWLQVTDRRGDTFRASLTLAVT
jgi:hypothetical protein